MKELGVRRAEGVGGWYEAWRRGLVLGSLLHDRPPVVPSERLLQLIWVHQRLRLESLRDELGRRVEVLHPGFWNHGPGPDFSGAVMRLGDAGDLVRGDVEIDLEAGGWRAHRHAGNPAYGRVILHVVWRRPTGRVEAGVGPTPARLVLDGVLDAGLSELAEQLHGVEVDPPSVMGRCARGFRDLGVGGVVRLLEEAGRVRLRCRGGAMVARAKDLGWSGVFWESAFAALGYRHNAWPFRWLSGWRRELAGVGAGVGEVQARILGLAGLLPDGLDGMDPWVARWVRGAWDVWWREREEWSGRVLPSGLWRFHSCRPANHPLRRLALAAHWLVDGDLECKVEGWVRGVIGGGMEVGGGAGVALLRILRPVEDPFWDWHWTFFSSPMERRTPLLGLGRVTDMVMNVVLPWAWARARVGVGDVDGVERVYLGWPAGGDNQRLRQVAARMFAGCGGLGEVLGTAARQQGAMQLLGDFCVRSDALCSGCLMPERLDGGG